MKIVKKSEAMKYLNTNTKIEKFCTGKYAWTGSAKDHYGKEVTDIDGVLAVFIERRQDSDGAYGQLRCVSKRN